MANNFTETGIYNSFTKHCFLGLLRQNNMYLDRIENQKLYQTWYCYTHIQLTL